MRHHDKRSTTGLVLSILAALVILSLAGMGSLRAGPDGQGPPTQVDQLRAFAKVYGYARFFHPSDEAAAADWEQLAVDGSARILGMTKKAFDLLVAAHRGVFTQIMRYEKKWLIPALYLKEISQKELFPFIKAKYE